MHTRTTTAALIAAGLLLSITGCSSDTDAKPAPAGPTASAAPERPAEDNTSDLQAAVRAYSDAYFKPDPAAAYKALSKRCKAKTDEGIFAEIVKGSAKDYGPQDIKTLAVDQQSGDLARVTYTYTVPKLNQTGQPWARENGQWRYDAC